MFLDIKRTDVFNRLGIVFCVFIFGMFFICLEIKIFVFYREKKIYFSKYNIYNYY